MDGEIALGGRWVTLRGERFLVYVIQSASGEYFTWCDDPAERTVQAYRDPCEAILAGLRRATRHGMEASSTHDHPRWVDKPSSDD